MTEAEEKALSLDIGQATLKIYFEVYNVDDKNNRTGSIGFVEREDVAKALVSQNPVDIAGGRTYQGRVVLTDGSINLLIEPNFSINVLNDVEVIEKIKEESFKDISAEVRALLGLQ
jgi:hypothetical protein